jgi:hypothetical protein
MPRGYAVTGVRRPLLYLLRQNHHKTRSLRTSISWLKRQRITPEPKAAATIRAYASDWRHFYALQLGLTLFGEWVLLAEWGHIGSPEGVKEEAFSCLNQAQGALSRRLSVKSAAVTR